MTWKDIPGWFDFEDFYSYAVNLAPSPAIFVEIGCWLGKSTAYLAQEIKNSGKKIKLHCVDTWQGSPGCKTMEDEVRRCQGCVAAKFLDNMRDCGVSEIIVPHLQTSVLAAAAWPPYWRGPLALAQEGLPQIDFVFIDADHRYDSVCEDIWAWMPKVKIGGLIAGHDFDSQTDPDVVAAVTDVLGSVKSMGRCWMARVGD